MSAQSPAFDRNAFRAEVKERLKGLPRGEQVLIAARCAWRAVPALFADEQNHDWVVHYREGLQAALTISLLEGYGRKVGTTADDDAYTYAAADAYVADDEAAIHAATAAYAAAYAAAYTAADEATSSDATADATADSAEAYYQLPEISSHWSFLVFLGMEPLLVACRYDLQMAVESPERLRHIHLWPEESTPPDWLRQWWAVVEATMGNREDARTLYRWLNAVAAAEPPLDEMENWVAGWWDEHPKNPANSSPQSNEEAVESKLSRKSADSETPTKPDPPEEVRTTYLPKVTDHLLSDTEAPELTKTAQECAAALHTFLASPDTRPPLTVSVEAPWGGGKSSLLRYLQRRLEGKVASRPKELKSPSVPVATVWFNPWKHEAGKTLWAAFAVAFERQLGDFQRPCWKGWKGLPVHAFKMGGHCLRKMWRHVKLSWLRLTFVEQSILILRLSLWAFAACGLYWLLSQGVPATSSETESTPEQSTMTRRFLDGVPWLGAVLLAWGFLKDMMKQFGSPLKLDMVRLFTHSQHRDGVDDLHRFQEDFRRLLRTYIPRRRDGTPGRVVVFIDDLDRCEAPKAADVLQSLFQMLHIVEDRPTDPAKPDDAPGVICILGMDREKVAAAVAAKHEKLLPLLLETGDNGKHSREDALDFGHTFLEKFIQLTLHLPVIQGSDRTAFLQAITGWDGKIPDAGTSAHPLAPKTGTPTPATGPDSKEKTPDPAAAISHPASLPPKVRAAQQAAVEKRIRQVEKELRDGHIAFFCASYAAQALENNPRKLKQFVNLFRLRLFIAAAMKHLDPDTLRDSHSTCAEGRVSAHHIAKLVALEIACPREMNNLRAKLQDQQDVSKSLGDCAQEDEPALKALIAYRSEESPAYKLTPAVIHLYFNQEETRSQI